MKQKNLLVEQKPWKSCMKAGLCDFKNAYNKRLKENMAPELLNSDTQEITNRC